ncbi:hypothetical protein BDZ91DRAFT_711430, partial [Kalaharituber pfeilii]
MKSNITAVCNAASGAKYHLAYKQQCNRCCLRAVAIVAFPAAEILVYQIVRSCWPRYMLRSSRVGPSCPVMLLSALSISSNRLHTGVIYSYRMIIIHLASKAFGKGRRGIIALDDLCSGS